MRLSDEEIYKSYIYPKEIDCRNTFEDGAEFARDFYENQKCITCKENSQCSIQVGLEEYAYKSFPMDEQDFGCTDWKSKE